MCRKFLITDRSVSLREVLCFQKVPSVTSITYARSDATQARCLRTKILSDLSLLVQETSV